MPGGEEGARGSAEARTGQATGAGERARAGVTLKQYRRRILTLAAIAFLLIIGGGGTGVVGIYLETSPLGLALKLATIALMLSAILVVWRMVRTAERFP